MDGQMDAKKEIIDVFLCHNGADKDWVRKLAEQVESETFDGNSDRQATARFFDEWTSLLGRASGRINQGLSMARYVAVVISPEFLQADWPALEWTHVVSDDPTNRKGRLIPVFLRDFSSHLNQTVDLPAPFRSLNWIDFVHLASLSSRSENSFDAFGIYHPNAGGANDHWRWRGPFELRPRNLRHRLPLTGLRMLFSVICYQWSRIRGRSGVPLPRPGRGKMYPS